MISIFHEYVEIYITVLVMYTDSPKTRVFILLSLMVFIPHAMITVAYADKIDLFSKIYSHVY